METRIFKAQLDRLDDVISFIDEELEKAGADMKLQTKLDIAVEELFVNVAHYAYSKLPEPPVDEEGQVDGECEITAGVDSEGYFTIRIKDAGVPFDPTAKADPDINLSAEEREIGGLGIYMVKNFMDRVVYEREGDRNVITIAKKL